MPRRDQVVTLCLQERETLALLGVLLHGERVHRSDRLERVHDPFGFQLERLEIEVEQLRRFEQHVERPLPLGFDALDDPPALRRGFGHIELQAVVFFAHRLGRAADVGQFGFLGRERGFGGLQGRFGLDCGRFERGELLALLVESGLPQCPLLFERGAVGIESRDFLGAGAAGRFGVGDDLLGAFDGGARRPQPSADMRFLHLPLRSHVARPFLFALQCGQAGARQPQLFAELVAARAAARQRGFDLGPALFCAHEAISEPFELRGGVGEFPVEIGNPARGILSGRDRLALGLAREVGVLFRLTRGRFQRRQLGRSPGPSNFDGAERGRGLLDFCRERLELGATSNRAAGRRRASQVNGTIGPSQRATTLFQHFGAAHQCGDPRCGPRIHPQSRVDRAAMGERPRLHRQEDERARLLARVPRLHCRHGRTVLHQHGVGEVAQQLLGELGLITVGRDEVGQRAQYAAVEAIALRQQCRGGRSETDAVPLERLEGGPTRREHGDVLFQGATLGDFAGLTVAGFPQPEARLFGSSRLVPGVFPLSLADRPRLGEPVTGVAALIGQVGAARRLLADALPQRCKFDVERGAFTFQRPKLFGRLLQGVLQAADILPLGGEPSPRVCFRIGATREFLADHRVFGFGPLVFRAGALKLAACLLQPHLRVAALFRRAPSPFGRVGQSLRGHRQVALDPAQGDAHAAKILRDGGTMALGGVPLEYGFLADGGDRGEPLAIAGQQFRQFHVTALEVHGVLRQLVEPPARQGQRDRELLFVQRGVALGLALLSRQRANLRLYLGEEILEPLQVTRRLLEAPRGGMPAVAIEADAGGLLEQRAPLVGAIGQQQVDHPCFDNDAGVAAEPGAAKQVLNIPETRRSIVEQVVALARPRQAAGDDHFSIRGGKLAVAVVKKERDLGDVHRTSRRGTLKDHVFHLAAAKQARGLLAEHPAHRVGHVRLAATVGTDNRRHTLFKREGHRVRKRLETGQFQFGELHRLVGKGSPTARM